MGLFGRPCDVIYLPNIEHRIDTSGILILDYPTMKCVCIGAKDCKAPLSNNIQGNQGCINIKTPVSIIGSFDLIKNDNTQQTWNENKDVHCMCAEFIAFEKVYQEKDYQQCYQMLEHSMIVSEVQTIARQKAGIVFGVEENALDE